MGEGKLAPAQVCVNAIAAFRRRGPRI